MLSDADRYGLALDVLRGEQDSHKILADMLEESGDRGAAQWARARKGKSRKRLDFVLGILPYRVSLALGCGFVGHVCRDASLKTARSGLEEIAESLCRDPAARVFRENTARLSSEVGPSITAFRADPEFDLLQTLMDLARTAWQGTLAEDRGDPKASVRLADDVRVGVRRLAKAAQRTAVRRRRLATYEAPRYDPIEVNWQIEHTSNTLRRLLQDSGRARELANRIN